MRPKRDVSIHIRLERQVLDRLRRLSRTVGVPVSTLCCMALGSFVAQQERNVAVIDRVATALGGEAAAMMRDAAGQQLNLMPNVKQPHPVKKHK